MKSGDIVKFKKVVDEGDETLRMVVDWVDGERVQVISLVNMAIKPTHIFPLSELEVVDIDPKS